MAYGAVGLRAGLTDCRYAVLETLDMLDQSLKALRFGTPEAVFQAFLLLQGKWHDELSGVRGGTRMLARLTFYPHL
jgi:hypothetical protein